MNTNNHLKPEQIKSLLYGELSDDGQLLSGGEFTNEADQHEQTMLALSDHIESCETCQKAMDEMAASPELWEKASELITDTHLSETIAVDLKNRSTPEFSKNVANATSDFGKAKDGANNEEKPWDYPVEHLFDPPSHPEMLGRIGDYDIEREVGRGGMGIVFRAFDHELNRPVAVKVLAPHLAASGAARKRFAREGRAAAAVLHPNVIAIHGVDSAKKKPYIVMPYIAGPSLQKLVDEGGPLEQKEMVRITMQIAGGLAAAHSQGVIHRDIKPANVLIEESVSRVVITDFGLARAENDASMTHTGWLAGTPNFMSPEQANGKRLDGRSDLFSLGSVMYFMATGRMPFRADAPMAVLNRICTDQPTPVRQVNSDVSRTFAEIVEKLLCKDPDDRFQSAGELHETLEQYLAYLHQPDISKPPVIFERSKINWISWIGIPLACLAVFAITFAAMNQGWFSNSPEEISSSKAKVDDGSDTVENPIQTSAPKAQGIEPDVVLDVNTGTQAITINSNVADSNLDDSNATSLLIKQASLSAFEQATESINERYSIDTKLDLDQEMFNIEIELQDLERALKAIDQTR